MQTFPLSWPMAGRTVAIVGRGALAARKLALIARTPARILAFAPEEEAFTTESRSFPPTAQDLAEADLIFVATPQPQEAEALAAIARAAGKPVNVVDRPDLSDFHVPAIVDRGEIVIGIGSGGLSPTLARHVRQLIEAAVPAEIARLGALARRLSARVRAEEPDPNRRRGFWERVFRGPAGARALAGDLEGAEALALSQKPGAAGVVHIVGAGPGDPELLTLKALRLLSEADLIVYDRLVDPRVLDLARRDADRIYVGKARADHSVPQEEIHALLVREAAAGKRVVRLKGGDPFVFGRGGEELQALREAGVQAHVVPGITAALGCAASVGAPLTHRDHAHAVTFVTGAGRAGEAEPDVEWSALAAANHTVVVYMGAARAGDVAARLMAAGRAAATPALIVENGTRPDERRLLTSLGALGDAVQAFAAEGPALLIVGEVAALADVEGVIASWREAA